MTVLLIILLFINTVMGVISYKEKDYKVSCFNFFSAGYCLAVLLYIILKPIYN